MWPSWFPTGTSPALRQGWGDTHHTHLPMALRHPQSSGPTDNRLQHYNYSNSNIQPYNFSNEIGESFVPPMGCPLEPSCYASPYGDNSNIVAYFSDDIIQFAANPNGGVNDSYGAVLYQNSGLKLYNNINDDLLKDSWANIDQYYYSSNIRKENINVPDINNVANLTTETANIYSVKGTISPLVKNNTRSYKLIHNFGFGGYPNFAGNNADLICKSFVVAYKDIDLSRIGGVTTDQNYIPFFDSILSGSNGYFIPKVVDGGLVDENGKEIYIITGIGSDINYNSLSKSPSSYYPIFGLSLSWQVPCPNGVIGC